jgi:purine-nucleoside phosphorylase
MYETAEEINFFKSLNGSAVGMSTVPEIEMGGKIGLNVLTISTLTNYAAGISKNKLSHDEVLLNANNAKDKILSLLKNILKRI